MKKSFNKEELTIMNFYNCDNRNRLINELESVVENVDEIEVETEVREIIIKLKSMTDSEFKKIDFNESLEIETEI